MFNFFKKNSTDNNEQKEEKEKSSFWNFSLENLKKTIQQKIL